MPARIVLTAIVLAASVAGTTHARPVPTAVASKACDVQDYPRYKGRADRGGYYTELSVKKVSCETGRSFMDAYTACRREHGLKGKCKHKVKGYSCTEKRAGNNVELDGVVKCKKGKKRINHAWQQFI